MRVYEIPPNTQGIAALIMLDLMEQFLSATSASPPRHRCT